jgi:cytochrome b
MPRIAVWDAPTRLFHWALSILVVFSFATGKVGGGWMDWHVKSGYGILALLAFRIAWGFVGSDSARFSRFLAGPRLAMSYARSLAARDPPAVAGHNPLGGWMVALMIVLLLMQAGSGLFADDDIATRGPLANKVSEEIVGRLTAFHEWNGWAIVAAVGLHVAAIAFYHLALRKYLVGPMLHGRMDVEGPAPRMASLLLAAVLFAIACAAVYWLVAVFPKAP